ncbi:MAG: hypothetical protein QM762_17945 [Chryseolinea sp.]
MTLVNKIFILLLLLTVNCSAQTSESKSIVGVWQADSHLESSAWPDTYQFFADGRFVFNFSQYDGAKRILRILGTYTFKERKIKLFVATTVEAVGGHLTRSTITSLSDSWELVDYTIATFKQDPDEPEEISIKECKGGDNPKPCALFDSRTYFRMDSDPLKYN